MNFNNWREKASILLMIVLPQFIVLTTFGMIFYAGGNRLDPNAQGYSFIYNTFSDSGRIVAHSGNPNMVSSVLWFIALWTLGFSIILFSLLIPHYLSENCVEKGLTFVGSLLGIFSGISFIGLAFAPADLYPALHNRFNDLGFIFGLLSIIFFTISMFWNKSYPRQYTLTFLVFTLITAIYVIVMFFGPDYRTPEGLLIQVVMQKIIAYSMIITFIIQSYGLWKLEKSS